jgi:hypothetical protein
MGGVADRDRTGIEQKSLHLLPHKSASLAIKPIRI